MGTLLYDSAHPGPSNDPQAAEEQASLAARLAATSIQAYGSITPEQAYHQYLRFLEATAVQLSSKRVHDHFNEHGLDVTSSGHPALFRIYGDGKLLSDGTDVSIVADTVAASRGVISDIIASGQSRTAPREIIDMLPARVVGPAGRPTSLPDWHEGDLRRQARDLFGGARSVFLSIRWPSLGIVSDDQRAAGLHQVWETSLGTNAVVTPYWDGQRLFAGSGGQACQLDPSSGQILHTRRLSGYSEVCFQSSGDTVFIASNGRVLAADAANLGTTKWTLTLQPLAAFAAVNILYAGDGYLYAACMGCVYALDPASGHVIDQNELVGLGSDEVRLAATGDLLLAVTGNVIVCMARDTISAERWRQSLPSHGPTANILVVGQTLYAAIDGHCLAGEPRDGRTTHQIDDGLTGEVRLAADAASLYCGGNGAVTARPLAGISGLTWDATLTSTPAAPVNLHVEGVNVLAVTDGYLYQLNPATGAVQFSVALTSQGENECRMTSDGVRLYCGIQGQVAGVQLGPA
jgi:outer membrane protein assembly factor BamB